VRCSWRAIAFYFSSRVSSSAGGVEVVETEESLPEPTTFDEMMSLAAEYSEQRRFGPAYGFLRLALDHVETDRQRVDAGYQMGRLLYDDFRHGGASKLDAASLYLQAAFAAAVTVDEKVRVGKTLLEVLQDSGEKTQFLSYLDALLAESLKSADKVELWKRNFEFLIQQDSGWHAMNEALAVAENLPMQNDAWDALINDMQLRSKEELLLNDSWYRAYVETLDLDDSSKAKMKLFEGVRSALGKKYKTADWKNQADILLRLAKVYTAVGNYEKGHDYLQMFMDMEPKENLSDALILFSRISRVRGDMEHAAELAKSLIRRFDFNKYTRDEVLEVVRLLEQHALYDDAMDLLKGCFSATESLNSDYAKLIQRAAVIEERSGHRASALNYMNQLYDLHADNLFDKAFTELINLNLEQSNYEAVENLVHLFIGQVMPTSDDYNNALFALFNAKYWLDSPIIEQLYVGAAAIQSAPEDPRTASVELRMAHYIEDMKLNDLAISYYNRIGLLNFFQAESGDDATIQNVGEQAMLGKARCLKKLEDWAAADHLYREICNRTKSAVVKSEAAIGWGELALQFQQRREAERRFDLAYPQMLSESDKVRYMLGRSLIDGEAELGDPTKIEENLKLLESLPDEERRKATIVYFNDTFDSFSENEDEDAMLRMIDIACQNDLADWLPIQSYMLRLQQDRLDLDKIVGLGDTLKNKDNIAGASIVELAQVTDQVEKLSDWVEQYKRKATK